MMETRITDKLLERYGYTLKMVDDAVIKVGGVAINEYQLTEPSGQTILILASNRKWALVQCAKYIKEYRDVTDYTG